MKPQGDDNSSLGKALDGFYNKVKNSKHINDIFSDLAIDSIPSNYLMQFRVYNDTIFKLFANQYIGAVLSPNNTNIEAIRNKELENNAQMWLQKMKLIN